MIPGNANTAFVAEFGICNPDVNKPKFFYARKVAAYLHIFTFEPEFNSDNNIYGIPGGLNEFPLMGNYNDMTERALYGDMWKNKLPQDIEDGYVLILEPKKD